MYPYITYARVKRAYVYIRDTQATQHDCLPTVHSLLSDGGKNEEKSVWWGKKYFVLGRLEQPRQEKNSCTSTTSPSNKYPFHLYSLSPHLLKFQQAAGATPL
jgi:hypothetical protein